MKRFQVKILTLVAGIIITASSCSKDDVSNSDMLIGNWTLQQFGTDDNNNNKVDEGELRLAAELSSSGSVHFKSDKTYTATYNYFGISDTETGTYTFSDNTITTVSDGETTRIGVNTLTNNKLIIKETDEWLVFTK